MRFILIFLLFFATLFAYELHDNTAVTKSMYSKQTYHNDQLDHMQKTIKELSEQIKAKEIENAVLVTSNTELMNKIEKLSFLLQQRTEHIVDATAYSMTEAQCDTTPEIGASNRKLYPGRDIAVSRDLEKHGATLGTWVRIESLSGKNLGLFRIMDYMAKSKKGKIDILMPDRKTVEKFGVKKVKIVIQNLDNEERNQEIAKTEELYRKYFIENSDV